MASLTIMRHSISEANEAGLCDSGRFDAALSLRGRAFARAQARETRECPDAIYASSMRRARETATIFASALKNKFGKEVPVIIIGNLKGQDHGDLEGLVVFSVEYLAKLVAMQAGDRSLDHGEASEVARRRQLGAFLEVVSAMKGASHQTALVVTHGDVVASFLQVMATVASPDEGSISNCQQVGPFDAADVAGRITRLLQPPRAAPARKL